MFNPMMLLIGAIIIVSLVLGMGYAYSLDAKKEREEREKKEKKEKDLTDH